MRVEAPQELREFSSFSRMPWQLPVLKLLCFRQRPDSPASQIIVVADSLRGLAIEMGHLTQQQGGGAAMIAEIENRLEGDLADATHDLTQVLIRPIRLEDEPLIARFHATLSDRSVY